MQFDERLLNGVSVLSSVVRNGSFAAAALALNMSQPGVSRAISRLEKRLGVRLLERTTRSVALTEQGRQLYEQAVPLLSGLEEVATSIVEGKATVKGVLRVNIHPFFSQLILGRRLKEFLETYPELQLALISREQLGDMVAEGFDLAIRFGAPRPSTLVARKLLETRILTVAAPSYLKKYGTPQTPRDLENGRHRLIDFRNPETGRPFQWEFYRGRKVVKIATPGHLIVSDVLTMHSICLTGYAIAQIMELGSEQMLANGQLAELFPEWSEERFPLYALYPSKTHLPAKTRAFIDFVLSLTEKEEHLSLHVGHNERS